MQSKLLYMSGLSIIWKVVNMNGWQPLHSFNQCPSSSYSIISAAPVVSAAKTNLYDKTFKGAIAHHDVSLVLLTGQSLLSAQCRRQRRGVNSDG